MPTHNPFTNQPDTWWDPKGPFWTLHAINPLRTSFILKHISSGRALDIGCGGGILSEALSKNFDTIGVDSDESLINIAKSRQSQVQYEHNYLEALKSRYLETFDLVTCLEVLEHVENPYQMIKDISEVIKPGGFVCFSTLNRNPVSFLGAIVAAEYILKILPKHTHEYEKFITPNEMIEECAKHNLVLKDIKGILYNPLTKSFSLGSTTIINYIACFQKQT